jgi:hypothetical protein
MRVQHPGTVATAGRRLPSLAASGCSVCRRTQPRAQPGKDEPDLDRGSPGLDC